MTGTDTGGLTPETREEMREIIARYPKPRSALLPMLHLAQSVEGYVSPDGIAMCAEELGLTKAEVGAVATFYTMYRRQPAGEYHVGVCTNTLCAVLGGDAILDSLKEHLGIGHNETTEDGRISLEHVECNAACDYAPVVMVNWEFYDNQTPASARELVDAAAPAARRRPPAGRAACAPSSRPPACSPASPTAARTRACRPARATLAGLELAKQRGDRAPAMPGTDAPAYPSSSSQDA